MELNKYLEELFNFRMSQEKAKKEILKIENKEQKIKTRIAKLKELLAKNEHYLIKLDNKKTKDGIS